MVVASIWRGGEAWWGSPSPSWYGASCSWPPHRTSQRQQLQPAYSFNIISRANPFRWSHNFFI
jgi:hypothetical protein